MQVDLSREDLLNMVKGTSPYYNAFEHPLVKKSGSYCGGFVEKWSWNGGLDKLTDRELLKLYKVCKESWKK